MDQTVQFRTKIYDKRYECDIANFPVLVGNVPPRLSYRVYISQLIRFLNLYFSI